MKFVFSCIPVLFVLLPIVVGNLRVGFYQTVCPQAENRVRNIVQQRFAADQSITAALLRMHFHDCFVNGCDASLLIDSKDGSKSEKEAGPNETVRGYELIDEIKKTLEELCPKTVSCADIITLATRDAVGLAGGPSYAVPTGRRDGLVASVSDVHLPGPRSTVSGALQVFRSKGLALSDMVILLGGHTVGIAHCNFFQDRLTGSENDEASNPPMDPSLAAKLKETCGSKSTNPAVFLDQNTSFVFDNEYYRQLILKKGILKLDQELAGDSSTVEMVKNFANDAMSFKDSFAKSMVKLANVGVLVGKAGEIRTNCRAFKKRDQVPPPPPPGRKVPSSFKEEQPGWKLPSWMQGFSDFSKFFGN